MRCLALLALLALATPVQASIILSAGQSATFNFYTMPLLDEFHNQPIVEAHIFFGIDELTPGELVQLDLYEELNATGTPFVTSNPPIGAPGPTQVINQTQFGDYWNDHNGSLTVSTLAGTVSIDTVWFTKFATDGFRYRAVIDADAVPTPPTLPLFATGLGLMALLGWRRRRLAADPTSS